MKRSKLNRRLAAAAWQPLQPATVIPLTEAQIETRLADPSYLSHRGDLTDDQLRGFFRELAKDEVWKNNRYQVNVRRGQALDNAPTITHLSIKRLDKQPIHDWRDLQRIKNQLVGPECEAIELYPAESRVVDLANQFHLWVFNDPGYRIPFGFDGGRHVDSRSGHGAVQRPREAAQ